MLIRRQKQTMQDMKERFGTMPTGSQVIVIDGVNYTVVSHYTGKGRNMSMSRVYKTTNATHFYERE